MKFDRRNCELDSEFPAWRKSCRKWIFALWSKRGSLGTRLDQIYYFVNVKNKNRTKKNFWLVSAALEMEPVAENVPRLSSVAATHQRVDCILREVEPHQQLSLHSTELQLSDENNENGIEINKENWKDRSSCFKQVGKDLKKLFFTLLRNVTNKLFSWFLQKIPKRRKNPARPFFIQIKMNIWWPPRKN